MKKTIVIIIITMFITTTCKGQDRVDLSTLSFNTPNLPVEEKPLVNHYSIFPPSSGSYQYEYKNIDVFCFRDFIFKNGGEKPITSTLYIYLDEKKEHIISAMITLYNNDDSNNFFDYIEKTYGRPIVLKAEPSKVIEGKPFGFAHYLWKDIANNRSIILSKNYYFEDDTVWKYDLSIYIIPTENTDRFKLHNSEVNAFEFLVGTYSDGAGEAAEEGIDSLKTYIENLKNEN